MGSGTWKNSEPSPNKMDSWSQNNSELLPPVEAQGLGKILIED